MVRSCGIKICSGRGRRRCKGLKSVCILIVGAASPWFNKETEDQERRKLATEKEKRSDSDTSTILESR